MRSILNKHEYANSPRVFVMIYKLFLLKAFNEIMYLGVNYLYEVFSSASCLFSFIYFVFLFPDHCVWFRYLIFNILISN